MGTWRGSMAAALFATLARPGWWSMALAAFLVRGGILLVLLPIVILPTPAALAAALAPTIENFVLGSLTAESVLVVLGLGAFLFVAIGASGLAGAWLDLALLREAADDEELDLAWEPEHASVREALSLRLTAHLPALAVAMYAAARFVGATYDELLSPGDPGLPIAWHVAMRAPDAVVLVVVAWLGGETVGSLAARRAAAGERAREALWRSTRKLLSVRGLATLLLTTAAVAGVLLPFLLGTGRAWDHLRSTLVVDADPIQVGAALLVFVATWILGLAVLGAGLAFRGAAWTAEVAIALPRPATFPEPAAPEAATP